MLEWYSPPGLEEVLVGHPGLANYPLSLPFWDSLRISLISLVIPNDGSKHTFVFLLMNSLLGGYQIRLRVFTPFTPASEIDG